VAWTYGDDPANSPRDELRLFVGDTNTADQLLTDAEITYYLARHSDNALAAAPGACEGIAALYSRQANTSNQGLSVAASERSRAYLRLADELRDRTSAVAEVFVGGLTISGKEALADDSDAIQPAFKIGLDDRDGSASVPDWIVP
jgi:hypothetical protein